MGSKKPTSPNKTLSIHQSSSLVHQVLLVHHHCELKIFLIPTVRVSVTSRVLNSFNFLWAYLSFKCETNFHQFPKETRRLTLKLKGLFVGCKKYHKRKHVHYSKLYEYKISAWCAEGPNFSYASVCQLSWINDCK